MSSLHNPPKAMLADNPFGVASSPHVLNLIFQLAESNNVQMICLTALHVGHMLFSLRNTL